MSNKPTVTVGLPVYNEEKGIKALLESVLKQNQQNFELKQIIVLADSPTDKTVGIVKSIDNPLITLVDDRKRKGQLARLNDIYKLFDADYLIQTDGDVEFGNANVINEIVREFEKDKDVYMVGGHAVPTKPINFVSRAITATVQAYEQVSASLNAGNNINTVHGCILGFRKEFVKNFEVPVKAVVNDVFLYYRCLQEGHKYAFAKEAIVFYKLPTNLQSHIHQNTRYYATSSTVDHYFPPELVQKECYIPKELFVKAKLTTFFEFPIESIFILLVNFYCKLNARISYKPAPVWQPDESARSKNNDEN